MSPQPQREIDNPLPAFMRSIISSSRWTDADDLVFVLGHANGDFDVAVDTILRHEATSQPLEELLSEEGRHFAGGSSSPPRRRHSYSENSTHSLWQVGLDGGVNRSVSEGGVPSCVFVPPSSTSLLEREGTESNALSRPFEQQQMLRYLSEYTRGMLEEEQQPGVIPASASSSTALVKNLFQTEKNELSHQMRTQRHDDVEVLNSRQQQMLQLQSGIEASVKETGNTSETSSNAGDEAEALSYAVKASRETFDKECLKQELRNAVEKKMIKMKLAESLSDPVKKSEEELIDEALKRSLSDPVPKSEEQLFEEAIDNSLRDIEMIKSICKAEEELVEEAIRKSLHTISKEEELIEAVKRQSLKSLPECVLGKKPTRARMPLNIRQSTSTTYPLSFADDDISECSSSFEVELEHPPPSRFDSPLRKLDSSDLIDLDRKMPALVLPAAAQTCDNDDVISSLRNPNVASEMLSSGDQEVQDDNISRVNVARQLKASGEVRSLSVEGASLSLINGVYEEVNNESKTFTRRLGCDGVIATACIYQTSTQDSKEWVFSITNSNVSPGSGTDVILYTASVDDFNDELPSPYTNWVGRNEMVMGGSPPKVTEL
jgi:hypothetical protein